MHAHQSWHAAIALPIALHSVGAWPARREEHCCTRGGGRSTMGQWPVSPINICLRIMELVNGRAARYGSARVVELVAAWVWWALLSRLRRFEAPNAAPSLERQARIPRSDTAAARCAARATTPADGATACLLPSYLTQLPPRPCHSFVSSISTSGPTTCDDRRRRRLRPPAASRIPQSLPSRLPSLTRLPFARGPLRRHIPDYHHPNRPIPTFRCAYSTRPPPPIHTPPPEQLARQSPTLCIAYFAVHIHRSTSPPIPHIGGFE